jgi:hypothetical protein
MKNHPLLALFFLGLTPAAHATLIAYEGFDYTAGINLNAASAANGGTGWANAWGTSTPATTANLTVVASSLSYSTLQTSGGALNVVASATTALGYRDLAAARGADGTTTWISALGYGTTPVSELNSTPGSGVGVGGSASMVRAVNFAFFDTSTTATPATAAGSERISFGEGTRVSGVALPDTDTWGILVAGSATNAATVWSNDPFNTSSFAVLRIDHGVGNVDTAYLWINPALGTEPTIGTADATTTGNFTFNRVRPFAGNANATQGNGVPGSGFWDELRVGETFVDIAPVPEPSSLMALVGLGLLGRRRRN